VRRPPDDRRARIAPAERLIVMNLTVCGSPVDEAATELRRPATERLVFVVDLGGRLRRTGPDAPSEADARLTEQSEK
jgi:hypothetical protein